MKYKILLSTTICGLFLLTGCSTANPFGIGYDSSVCTDSKSFGVCGSPENLYKFKNKLKLVQNEYLEARLDIILHFGVNDEGVIQVKADRDAPWERYDISEWHSLIKERRAEFNKQKEEDIQKSMKRDVSNNEVKVVDGWSGKVYSDLPVTKGDDLSIKYQKQGPLIITRTKIGDIIRDQGYIQQILISNYVDYDGDLISSHEAMIVVKEPDWIVGEKTPKNRRLDNFPTPMSEDLIKSEKRVNIQSTEVVNSYNRNSTEGYIKANEYLKNEKDDSNTEIINNFIN